MAKASQAHMDPRACVAHQPLDTDTLGPCAYCETVQIAEERDALREERNTLNVKLSEADERVWELTSQNDALCTLLRECWVEVAQCDGPIHHDEQHAALAARVAEALR